MEQQKNLYSRNRLPELTLILVGLFSMTALIIAGHVWRFPVAIAQMIDATFLFALCLPFAIHLPLAMLLHRLISYLGASIGRRIGLAGATELGKGVRAFSVVLGLASAATYFSINYFGITLLEFETFVLLVLAFSLVLLYSVENILMEIRVIARHSADLETLLKSVLDSQLVKKMIMLALCASFSVGELHMGNLLVGSHAQWETSHKSTTTKVLGPTSGGMIVAEYFGTRWQNRKSIVLTHVSDGNMGELVASRETHIVPLTIAAWVLSKFDARFGFIVESAETSPKG